MVKSDDLFVHLSPFGLNCGDRLRRAALTVFIEHLLDILKIAPARGSLLGRRLMNDELVSFRDGDVPTTIRPLLTRLTYPLVDNFFRCLRYKMLLAGVQMLPAIDQGERNDR